MKPAPFALLVLAVLVSMAWPLSVAIGSAREGAVAYLELRPAACTPEGVPAAPSERGASSEGLALPPGHPPIARDLPPGHPPLSGDGLPPGHPPVGGSLPPGHPPVPSGRGFGAPAPADLFGTPVLLTI